MFLFPLWLGLAGAVLPVVTLLEGILLILWLSPIPIRARDFDQLFEFWIESAKYSVSVGVVMGLIAMVFAIWRRGRKNSECAGRFGANLGWCLALALVLIAFNDTIYYVVAKNTGWITFRGPGIWALITPLILAGVFNFVAVMCAIAHTISGDDVLAPRVLVGKLRRSAKLMG